MRHARGDLRYTLDGSTPDRSSTPFDAYQLPVLEAINVLTRHGFSLRFVAVA